MPGLNLKAKRKFIELKPKVIALRKIGKTYSEIRKIYPIPKSTLSDGLREIEIPLKINKKMEKRISEKCKKTIELNARKTKEKAMKIRQEIENRAKKEIKSISKNELKLIGSALYWAEGSKHRNQLRISNSDPNLIETMVKFFLEVLKVPKEKLKARIHIFPELDYKKCLAFWSRITGLPKTNFYSPQTQISRASKRKRFEKKLPYGTFHLIIANTKLASKVRGWIRGIIDKI